MSCQGAFGGPFQRLQGLFELLSVAADTQYSELEKNPMFSDKKEQLMSYLGGIDNAVNTQVGLGILALNKVAEHLGGKISDLDLLEQVLKTNRHVATQFGNLHIAALQLMENLSGIIPNQLQLYQFEADNFELAKSPDFKDDQLYLLPTMNFLDKVVRLGKETSTEIELHRAGGNQRIPFFAANSGPIFGCPLFRATKDFSGKTVKLEDWFFHTVTTLIKGVMMPLPNYRKEIDSLKGAKRLLA